jgi:hypothetical protein
MKLQWARIKRIEALVPSREAWQARQRARLLEIEHSEQMSGLSVQEHARQVLLILFEVLGDPREAEKLAYWPSPLGDRIREALESGGETSAGAGNGESDACIPQ